MGVGLLLTNSTVFILGAGPAGISLSHYLSELKIKNVLFEARDSVGGMARSWEWNNFIVDTGPHILHTDDSEIWALWKKFLNNNLSEKNFYSGNFKTIDNKTYIYDYPLNIEQISKSPAWNIKEKNSFIKKLKESNRLKNLGESTSFREYMRGLVGPQLEETFFRYYPEKVWGISTEYMLPDWAPKRIRICKKREPFYKGEIAGIAEAGTGELMENIIKNSCYKYSKIFMNSRVIGLKTNQKKIIGIEYLSEKRKHIIKVGENDLVINTLPVTLVSKMLGKNFDITFRGILSIYSEIERKNKEKILPKDFNWLYFGDKKTSFNRITEPTSMSKKLDLAKNNRKYLISETCLDYESSDSVINKKVGQVISDLSRLPFIKDEILSTTHNWEKFVYPIQTLDNIVKLKKAQSWISQQAKNLESIGTSADFAYNDIQVIFKKAKELSLDIKNSSKFNLSKVHFNKLVNSENEIDLSKPNELINLSSNQSTKLIFEDNSPCKIIAEIGINHNGSVEQLFKLCELACINGADIVKFQYFDAKKRIGSNVRELEHIEKAQDMEENIFQLLDRCELSLDILLRAKKYIEGKGCTAMCTPFSGDAFNELIGIGFDQIKISSMDLNNYHLHQEIIKCDKPLNLFISTGMSSISELKIIYELYQKSNHKVCLLLCTSSYPAPNTDISLSNILIYKNLFPRFGIGYSDHTTSNTACIAAASLGSEFIEIHFSDDIRKSGPDQILSKTGSDLKELRDQLNSISELINFREKSLRESEYSTWRTQKKGLYASREIEEGEFITIQNTIAQSPPTDISPLILKNKKIKASKKIAALESIKKEDITFS